MHVFLSRLSDQFMVLDNSGAAIELDFSSVNISMMPGEMTKALCEVASNKFYGEGREVDFYEKHYEYIAKIAHNLNKALCESFGDTSQPDWSDAPEWQKESAVNGVRFHHANPEATPEQSHENWLEQKRIDGWAYSETKDPGEKLHPCFRPYSELPAEQRAKDYIFRSICHQLLVRQPCQRDKSKVLAAKDE
jgi:hypothetical protein